MPDTGYIGLGTFVNAEFMIDDIHQTYTTARNRRGRRYPLSDRAIDRSYSAMFETMESAVTILTETEAPSVRRQKAEDGFNEANEKRKQAMTNAITEQATIMAPIIAQAVKEAVSPSKK